MCIRDSRCTGRNQKICWSNNGPSEEVPKNRRELWKMGHRTLRVTGIEKDWSMNLRK